MSNIIEEIILDALEEASTIARAECEEVDFSPTEQQWNQFAKRLRVVARAGENLMLDACSTPRPLRKRLRLCPRRPVVALAPPVEPSVRECDVITPFDLDQVSERLSSSLQPPLRATNLAEASQAAFCSGRTVSSRRPGALVDVQASSRSKQGNFWEVTTAATSERRSLYSGSAATDLDLLSTSAPVLPTPAAVKHSELNFRAECAALERQIHVDTKLALLQGTQPLREKIAQLNQRRELRLAPSHVTARPPNLFPWVSIEAADHGVCSVVFRGALRMFLLWDSQSQRWSVWNAEWLWKARVSPCGLSGTHDVLASGSHQIAPVGIVQQAPVMAHMRRVFAERGFAEGCLAAISAVAGLWMELCDQQTSWLVGELTEALSGSSAAARISVQLDTQVNSGFISVFFTISSPTASNREREATDDRSAIVSRTSIQTKWLMSDGTVYRISQLGTDLTSRVVVDVLNELAAKDPLNRVVDVEPTLWSDWMRALQVSRGDVGNTSE